MSLLEYDVGDTTHFMGDFAAGGICKILSTDNRAVAL